MGRCEERATTEKPGVMKRKRRVMRRKRYEHEFLQSFFRFRRVPGVSIVRGVAVARAWKAKVSVTHPTALTWWAGEMFGSCFRSTGLAEAGTWGRSRRPRLGSWARWTPRVWNHLETEPSPLLSSSCLSTARRLREASTHGARNRWPPW